MTLRYETGRSLNTFVDKNWMSTVPRQSCYNILQQIADALAFIHVRRMTHDDATPENIMWSPEDRRAVLIDFGQQPSTTRSSQNREHLHTQRPNTLQGPRHTKVTYGRLGFPWHSSSDTSLCLRGTGFFRKRSRAIRRIGKRWMNGCLSCNPSRGMRSIEISLY